MKKNIIGLIPTRLNSKRLPKKALLDLDGLPMIVHTYKRAILSKKLSETYVCTDSEKIISICKKYNINFIKTSSSHKNGTERIAEASLKLKKKIDIIVDIQGDEPLIKPDQIDKVIEFHLKNYNFDLVVPYLKLKNKTSKNVVKIVSIKNKVIYFSRENIPYEFKKKNLFYKKHHSIISFKINSLKKFSKLPLSKIEKIEGIELMRALENNFNIGTFMLKGDAFSVDILEDYLKAKNYIQTDKLRKKYK